MGGSIFREITSAQFTCLKKGCLLINSASSAPAPSLWQACLLSNFLSKSFASGVKYGGRLSLHLKIFSMVFFRFSAVNGGAPVNMSNIKAPRDHQSTPFPCPVLVRISGAMYSMVPQKVWVTAPSWMASLQRPKSVNLMCPLKSRRMFSGFKSR